MSDYDPTSRGRPTASQGRLPSPEEAAAVQAQVAAVLRVLASAEDEANGARGAIPARLVEKYRGALSEAMSALAGSLAPLSDGATGGVDVNALRTGPLAPILSLSRSLPMFRRAEESLAARGEPSELHRILLEGRPAGYDVSTLLLDDYYHRGAGATSLRTRSTELVEVLHRELRDLRRSAQEGGRLLVLGASSVLNVGPVFAGHDRPPAPSIVLADKDTSALRRARQSLEANFGLLPTLLRIAPVEVTTSANRPRVLFDVIYTLTLYDVLPPAAAFEFTRGIAGMLKPGGALITGAYLPTLSPAHRTLAYAFIGMRWSYWGPDAWKQLISQLPFDAEGSRIESHRDDTLVILARRKSEKGP